MKFISWNVNGIRSNIVDNNSSKYKLPRKIDENSPLDQIISTYQPDIVCFQETRLGPDLYHLFQTDHIKKIYPYQYWSSSQGEKGRSANRYSGTSIWSKHKPNSIKYDFDDLNDREGRFIQLTFDNFIVITTYTPNTGSNWDYRLDHWEPKIRDYLYKLSLGKKPVIYCGDNNIANKEDIWFGDLLEMKYSTCTDASHKKKLWSKIKTKTKLHTGEKILCGYSKEERDCYKLLLNKCDFIDCYRHLNKDIIDKFTWFNIRIKDSYKNNLGWLIDRFLVGKKFGDKIKRCSILNHIGLYNSNHKFISDHLPIFLVFLLY